MLRVVRMILHVDYSDYVATRLAEQSVKVPSSKLMSAPLRCFKLYNKYLLSTNKLPIDPFRASISPMITTTFAAAAIGYDGKLVTVECDTSNGLPALVIVGLANKSIDEARERIRSAIKNSELTFPKKRITINLAPADLPKMGTAYDLAMAIAILSASGQLHCAVALNTVLCVGELALDGKVQAVRSVIHLIEAAKKQKMTAILLPAANLAQAQLVEGIIIVPIATLSDAVAFISTGKYRKRQDTAPSLRQPSPMPLLEDIHGQNFAKRALIICAAGRHNLLMDGPPGAGKTMLAQSMQALLPELSGDEVIAATKIHSSASALEHEAIIKRPFRSPHHTISRTALVGGGRENRPGEISLAHTGVLFLDELPEYARSSLEALRQPLEDKEITITRANGQVRYPADFTLIATRNPCPCGFLHDQHRRCECSPYAVLQYQKRVSGPLLDRIDLIVNVEPIAYESLLTTNETSLTTVLAKQLIAQARERQRQRFGDKTKYNAHLSSREIKTLIGLTPEGKQLLDIAAAKLHLSTRAYMKTLKVARTIADITDEAAVTKSHISEALQYRQR